MKILIIILVLLLTSPAFSQVTEAEKNEIKTYIAERESVQENAVEVKFTSKAVAQGYTEEREEIVERLKRKKLDECKSYDPTEAEIITEVRRRTRLHRIRKCSSNVSLCRNQNICKAAGRFWYNDTCNTKPMP